LLRSRTIRQALSLLSAILAEMAIKSIHTRLTSMKVQIKTMKIKTLTLINIRVQENYKQVLGKRPFKKVSYYSLFLINTEIAE